MPLYRRFKVSKIRRETFVKLTRALRASGGAAAPSSELSAIIKTAYLEGFFVQRGQSLFYLLLGDLDQD